MWSPRTSHVVQGSYATSPALTFDTKHDGSIFLSLLSECHCKNQDCKRFSCPDVVKSVHNSACFLSLADISGFLLLCPIWVYMCAVHLKMMLYTILWLQQVVTWPSVASLSSSTNLLILLLHFTSAVAHWRLLRFLNFNQWLSKKITPDERFLKCSDERALHQQHCSLVAPNPLWDMIVSLMLLFSTNKRAAASGALSTQVWCVCLFFVRWMVKCLTHLSCFDYKKSMTNLDVCP